MIGHVPIRKNPWREIRITGLWRCRVRYCNPGPVVEGGVTQPVGFVKRA